MTNQIPTLIIDSDPQAIELLTLYIKDLDYIDISGGFTDGIDGCNMAIETKTPIIIIDISKKAELALTIIDKVTCSNPDCKIIVTSSNYGVDNIVKAMRAGAQDFLPKPIIKEDLVKALNKAKDQISGVISENKKGRVITTFSNKGGIGKTTIATNLAIELANTTKEKVALIDLNLQSGDVSTFLDINPPFDLSYIIRNLDNIDESFLLNTLEKYKDTSLYVLAEPPFLEQAKDIETGQIVELLETLKQTFSYIIVDTGANFDEKTTTALDNSDLILLVSIVNLPAIRNCQRCLNLFQRFGYEKEKTKVILNRYMENDEIKIEDVEKVLEQKVFWKIPNNYFTIMSAINKGLPIGSVNAESNVSQSYRELAAILSDNIHKQNFAKKISRKSSPDSSKISK